VTLKITTEDGVYGLGDFANGAWHPGDKPGLGVDIDETLAAHFPYERGSLPIARKLDGTMHSW
jgi:mannonate dehydratase